MKNAQLKVTPSPFIVTRPTITSMSLIMILSLSPHLFAMIMQHDFVGLLSIVIATAGSITAEISVAWTRKKQILLDGTAILTGLLIGFLLPSTLGPVFVFCTAFSGCLLSRAIFGGTGSYWMNPVAVAVALAFLSQRELFPPFLITPETVTAAGDAFGALKIDHFSRIQSDTAITDFFNTVLLGKAGISLPEGYITLFWQSPSPIPAFRYNMLTLLASIVLLSMKIIDWIVPAVFLFTYGLLVYLFTPVAGGRYGSGDILFALLTGGVLFVAFFILSEFSTAPRTRMGKLISGFAAGIICFLLCGPGGSPAGAAFTVIAVNPLSTIIEYVEKRVVAARRVYA